MNKINTEKNNKSANLNIQINKKGKENNKKEKEREKIYRKANCYKIKE
jgi:uncharacterized protein (UPF0248 family)